MYLGKILEIGSKKEIFQNPKHPYTKALLSSIPQPDPIEERKRNKIILEGDMPSPQILQLVAYLVLDVQIICLNAVLVNQCCPQK